MKSLTSQKRISAQILKIGVTRVWFDPDRLEEVKEAITKADIRRLINDYAIQEKPMTGTSRGHARKRLIQRRKGRQKGPGTKKGTHKARLPKKRVWIVKMRGQRGLVKEFREKSLIDTPTFKEVYAKIKGGFFRSRRHIKLYLTERNMFQKPKK
ncbi:MAG: 50S ribosomal protein L19e [archaeon]